MYTSVTSRQSYTHTVRIQQSASQPTPAIIHNNVLRVNKFCHNSPYKDTTQRQWTQRSNPLKISDLQWSVQNKYDLKMSPSATQDSEIQNTTQRKSQRLAERQQTLPTPQANEQPPKPKGKKRQRPSEYKLHNNDISYCAVRPLDPENRATSLWDYKKVCVAGTFNDTSDALNCTNTICKLQKW